MHIVTEAAKALDHAHRKRVIHRDVKPGNIFLSADHGDTDWVLVGDFGIARSTETESTRTVTERWAFSAPYAPPEQRAGLPVDYSADVHALGVTLYELLTGRQPRGLPGTDTDRLPPAMRAVIAKATAADPAERYPSCGELAAAATAALHTETATTRVMAGPAWLSRTVRRSGARTRLALRAGAVVTVSTAVLFLILRADADLGPPAATSTTSVPPSYSRCHFVTDVPVAANAHAVIPSTNNGGRYCILSTNDSPPGGTAQPLAGVTALQTALRLCEGREITDATGMYGQDTKTDVQFVQDKYHLTQDGVYGPKTSAAMLWPVYDATGNQVGCGQVQAG
ncbi:serine/threonine-protein kinase [Nocardia crassostreae]|uniref:serine/threonine-protein kinase n=1 Tax=Nocardia crassostreae TaxID=53428 RepID=UPI00082C2F83|nr:serine/threonine-protein kinase [Nocardia crassostreae]